MTADAPSHPGPDASAGPEEVQRPPGTQKPRRRRQLDWELITCGTSGHVLVGPEVRLPPEDAALVTHDDGDVRWHRCLRCDTWIALPRPDPEPEARAITREELELPLRGRPLHDKIILRLIAVDRVVHFVVLVLLGIAVLAFTANRTHLRDEFYRVLAALQGGVAGGPVQTTGHVGILHELDRLFSLRSGTLHEVGIALLAYGVLEGVEAIGLWHGKRWAEYLTFISTTVLLPLEIYEIVHSGTLLKVIGFLINLAVVIYLLLRKRLFGLRGGGAAEDAERRRDVGWPAIQRATLGTPGGPPLRSAAVAGVRGAAGVAGGAGSDTRASPAPRG